MKMTLEEINKRAEKVKYFIDNLYKQLKLPVYIGDDVCRVIAIATLSKEGGIIWLNGKEIDLQEVSLRIIMDYHERSTNS